MGLCLYFLTVFEGDADIVSAVDGGMVHQRMPVFDAELGERIWHFLKGFKEGFNVGSLQLHLLKLSHDRLQALLCSIKSVRKAVIAFLVFCLVEGDVGVFVDALLHHIRNQLCFFQQGGLFCFQLRSVKEQVHHFVTVGNNLILGGQQLVCRRQEGVLDVLIRQVRRGAMLVVIEFVIALLDGFAVFAVGMPDL